MVSVVINLIGSPSVGKSTTAAKLLAELKARDLDVEMVQEIAKTWCLTGRAINKYDQYYLFGCECQNQSRLFGAVDFIVSDSSPILAAFYHNYYNGGDNSLVPACQEFYRKATTDNVKVINLLLPRKRKYVAKGRYQGAQEADKVATLLREWLDKEGFEYIELDCPDKDRLDYILDIIRREVGDFDGMSMV